MILVTEATAIVAAKLPPNVSGIGIGFVRATFVAGFAGRLGLRRTLEYISQV